MKKIIFIFVVILHLAFNIDNCKCQWDTLKGFVGGTFLTIKKVDSTIFAGTSSILLKSTNEGISWQDAGLPCTIYVIEYFDNRIFVGTSAGIYISTNVGANWIKTKDNNWTYCFEKSGSYIFAGSYSSGVLVSTNSGSNWTQTSFQTYTVMSITILNNCVFAASSGGLFKSDNWGLTWSQLSYIQPYKIHSYGSSIFAFSSNSGGTSVVYKSTNLGLNWTQLPGIPYHINTIKQIYNQFFISTSNNGVFVTEGLDLPWTQTNLYYSTAFIDGYQNLAVKDSSIYVGTNNDGIYYSHNLGVNWTNAGTELNPYFWDIASMNETVFALSEFNNNILYRSTNNGTNWMKFKYFPNEYYKSVSTYDSIIYVYGPAGISKSSYGGLNWIKTTNNYVTCLFKNGNKLYQASDNAGLWISTNSGLNWSLLWNNNPSLSSVIAFDSTIIVTAHNVGIFLSSNNGSTWQQTITIINGLWKLQKTDSAIFCGHDHGVLKSTDGGFNWSNSGLDNVPVYDFEYKSNYLFAATNVGVFMSSNYGVNWVQKNQNLGTRGLKSLDMSYNYIFAVPRDYSYLWRRLISNITSVKLINNETPKSFSLEQNYPNPFNPETTVKFNIPKSAFVTIKIYDILGKELQTLVQKQLTPGTYQLNFNASDYPSGVYFYRLTASDNSSNVTFTETKRLVYMK